MTLSQIDTFGLKILCIDDSKLQLALYHDQLEGLYEVSCALTYEEAIASLTTGRPDLVILDMEMPHVSGLEFLDILRSTPNYARIPVIIVSGDNDPKDVKEAFMRGAADYVRKPYDAEELLLRIHRIFQLMSAAGKGEGSAGDATPSGVFTAAQAHLIQSIAELAGARDNEGTKHLARVGLYAEAISETASKTARYRNAISPEGIERIAALSPLHDIGKVNVPDYILHKPEDLSAREFDLAKRHTSDGARTVDMIRLSFPDYGFLDFAHDIILYHHERWDGTGYPEGRAGGSIPLSARVVAIADAFDAMMTKRAYRDAVRFEEARDAIVAGSGAAFDPDLVEAFRVCEGRLREIAAKNRDAG